MQIILQPKQSEAFNASSNTACLFYGGAKGGGKSYLIRAREVFRRLKYPNTNGLIVRKTYPELLSNHIRMFFKEYPETINWYNKSEKTIYWPNGSITEFSHLGGTDDVYTYQGREYADISIDEITQHEELVFKILRSSNRTTNPDINPTMLLTGNPGGLGHVWAKRLFIDKIYQDNENPADFGFVQAKVYDNKALLDADPQYLQRLQALPEKLRRAYLEGDWDVFSGQVFSEFRRDLHTIKPVMPSKELTHFLWIDWGYSGKETDQGAFAALAGCLIRQEYEDQKFNRIVVYKEWYGKYKNPDEWAEIIYSQSPIKYKSGVADSSMFNTQTDGSAPIAELMERKWNQLNKNYWLGLTRGTKNRVGRVATLHNWLSLAPDGLPYLLISESCQHLIRTLPLLIYDEYNVEDVETNSEDHLYDSLTYGLSDIHFIPAKLGGVGLSQRKKALPAVINELNLKEFEYGKPTNKDWRAI